MISFRRFQIPGLAKLTRRLGQEDPTVNEHPSPDELGQDDPSVLQRMRRRDEDLQTECTG